jgi:hypothetical protein
VDEFELYLQHDLAPSDSEPLTWWASMEKIGLYKTLSRMARDVLGIPASSVDSERVFSSARDMIPYQRNCLKGMNNFSLRLY